MATYQELRTRSQQVRDEQNIGGNTALRVGQLLMDIVKYFYDNDAAASEYLQQHFAMVNDGTQLLNWQQSPIVILHTMGEAYDDGDSSALSHGENFFRNGFIMEANGQGGGINGETPKANVLYVNLANDTLYTWNGASFDAITSGGGGSISGDDIIKNAYYSNGNLVLIVETEGGDKTVTIPVNFDASNYVPTSRTVNGKALSNNIVIGMADIPGLETAIGEAGKVKSVSVNNGTPVQPDSNGNVNIQVQTGGETVVINSDGANIVDEHDNNSVLLAPSARQMKLMYNNIVAIYNGLANIAFTNGKPTLDWVGSKTKYTLSYGTLTGCTADVAAGQVNEGALRIKLTPTQASYAFTSVTVNGESVATTATGDADGSVYLDIVVNGNITVAATAISGRGITFNGTGCSIGAAGVAIGQDLDTTITANEHFTLPASITVKIGNSNVTHTYTRAQDGKTATLHIDAANITGDLTITCTADEDAHVTIAISGSNFVVKQGNAQLSNGSKVYNGSAAQTLTIEPASGYKFSTLPSADKGTMTNNGPYEASSLVISTSVSGTLTITAAGSALQTFSIDLSGLVGVTSSNSATSILEGSPYSTTLSKTDASASGSVIIGTCTMGNETITANNNTISIEHVTGNIVLAASVGVGRMMVNSWGYTPTTDANGKHYIPDDVGDFWLYSKADAQTTTMYPTGSYGNLVTGKDNTTNGIGGYGDHRNLGTTVNDNGTLKYKVDFTLRVKHLQAIPNGNGILYNAKQTIIKCFYGNDVKWGAGFSLVLNSSGSDNYGTQYMKLNYGNGTTALSVQFTEKGVTDATPYDYILSFVQGTMKATLYRVGQNGTVEKCGEQTLTVQLPLYAFIYIPDANNMQGLDLFNYAMTQQEVEGLYQNN